MDPIIKRLELQATARAPYVDTGIRFTQADLGAYQLHIRVFDGDTEIDYASLSDAKMAFVKPDKTIVRGDAQVMSDGIRYAVGTTELQAVGVVLGAVQLWEGETRRLTTATYQFAVVRDPLALDSFEESYTRIPELEALYAEMEKAMAVVDGWLEDPEQLRGPKGDKGDEGAGMRPAGLYATLAALKAAHPAGQKGDAWAVGTAVANEVYIWDIDKAAWVSIGDVKGEDGKDGKDGDKGEKGDPTTVNGKSGANIILASPDIAHGSGSVGEALDGHGTRLDALGNPNLLINGALTVWQRGAIFPAPANIYTADRWRANGSGTMTKVASGGMQITGSVMLTYKMEDVDFAAISGKTVTLSYSKDGVVVTQTYTASSVTVVTLTLSNCALNWIKLELGSIATPFSPRPYAQELAMCQRYYEKSYDQSIIPASGMTSSVYSTVISTNFSNGETFKVSKRISPTVRIFDGLTGNENYVYNRSLGLSKPITGVTISENRISSMDFDPAQGNLAGNMLRYGFTADAEIY